MAFSNINQTCLPIFNLKLYFDGDCQENFYFCNLLQIKKLYQYYKNAS